MPTYNYKCYACEAIQELQHSIHDSPTVKCDKCQGETKRIILPSNFHLSGGGWYSDGYSKN